MNKYFKSTFIFFIFLTVLIFSSCKSTMLNTVSTAMSSADKKGVPVKVKPNAPNTMNAFMGEKDPVIVQEVLPVVLKIYEVMHIQNPKHLGTQNMLGSLNVMYANLCVESKAELLTDPRLLDEQVAEFERAKLHYVRGHDLIFATFEKRHRGFTKAIMGTDDALIQKYCAKLSEEDVNAIYWACAGFFASFALNPLDASVIGSIKGHIALLERAAELNPNYSNGAIWDVLAQIYTAAPTDFGGDFDRGIYCVYKALDVSGGKSAGIYVTKAKSICIPNGDKEGFVESLNKALNISLDEAPDNVLMNVLNQAKAKRLLSQIDDYFIEW